MTGPADEDAGENVSDNVNEQRSAGMAGQEPPEDTIDFFGASASPTLPVPTTPAPEPSPEPPAPGAPAPAAPAAQAAQAAVPVAVAEPRVRRGVRVRTLVFGLVLLTISILSGIGLLTDVQLDGGVVGLGLMVGAGAGLLIGGLSAAVRDLRRGGARFG